MQAASAQTMQLLKTCQSLTVDADTKIRACSVFLDTGRQYNGTPLIKRARYGITLLRAVGYNMKQDFDRALADLNTAIRMDPSHFEPYIVRGSILLTYKQYDRASADFREALRLMPSSESAKKALQSVELVKQIDSRWESYLLEIQDDHDFANWSGPPLEIYRNAR